MNEILTNQELDDILKNVELSNNILYSEIFEKINRDHNNDLDILFEEFKGQITFNDIQWGILVNFTYMITCIFNNDIIALFGTRTENKPEKECTEDEYEYSENIQLIYNYKLKKQYNSIIEFINDN